VCATGQRMAQRSLEDLVIWQAARDIAAEVYRQTGGQRFELDPHLRGELRSAARGAMANIAAGYGADDATGLARGFDRASRAVTNLASLLHLTVDLHLLDRPKATPLLARTIELARLIRGWQRAIRAHEKARRGARVN